MAETVIQVENLSKAYRIGSIGTGTISRDLERWLARIRKKDDPFLIVGEENDRTISGNSDIVWSLRNINIDIKKGEAIGIIGGNGAGKSTLLKILSRVTAPTTGNIKIKGRIASLLEVGTGFHPELTGRENIYLNGAILGMRKREITKRFDEMVNFAGVERYIDTPVKRYSSGMYVRLAFAVAAHLEPDIMIVDEVLAVGDAEFQKKCLGKMNEVSREDGRTILFVSHNMQAINNLCTNAIWLDKGTIKASGDVSSVVSQYLSIYQTKTWKREFKVLNEAPGNDLIRINSVELVPKLSDQTAPIDIRTTLTVKFEFYNSDDNIILSTSLILFTAAGDCIFDISSKPALHRQGFITGECTVPGNFLNDGAYYFTLHFVKDTSVSLFTYNSCLVFEVADYRENTNWYGKWWGAVRPNFPLTLQCK